MAAIGWQAALCASSSPPFGLLASIALLFFRCVAKAAKKNTEKRTGLKKARARATYVPSYQGSRGSRTKNTTKKIKANHIKRILCFTNKPRRK
jgi:hypothetical protein